MNFDITVEIRGVDGVADPEGRTIERALGSLGFGGASQVHVGKTITFALVADDATVARATATQMCERLLANPVIERYEITVTPRP
jgi:phosphoribosylformylglycinamidine synthase